MNPVEMQRKMAEIARAITHVADWEDAPMSEDGIAIKTGTADGWILFVMLVDDAGSTATAGTATKGGTIVKLPPELCDLAVASAFGRKAAG